MTSFNYLFNINGNFKVAMDEINKSTGKFAATLSQTQRFVGVVSSYMAKLAVITDGVTALSDAIGQIGQSGIALDTSLTDLSALTGLVGDDLKVIEGYARESAKVFGIDAAQAVESYKMILGQLSPELAKSPQALKAMGDHVATLSKLMGGDATAAAEALNTAMNQYNIDLSDPIKASEEMGRLMNVMAAAARAGSAEVPQIKAALEQAGMSAESAGVSFEETNAAIQVLDKAGKKGSEGGVALRNVMATLAQGRFLPKQARQELAAAGVDVNTLTDNTHTLSERLRALAPLQQDSALLSKLFGKENAASALALISNVSMLDELTDSITGTTSAQDQAAIVMDSYAEQQAKINAIINDFKIDIFQATEGVTGWVSAIASSLVPFAQLMPIFSGLLEFYSGAKGLMSGFGVRIKSMSKTALGALAAMRRSAVETFFAISTGLRSGGVASLGFVGGIVQATWAVIRFATVGLWQGLKALAAYILSLVTGGATSTAFAATSATAFAGFKLAAVTACRAVSAAIYSIPIVGWVAIAITAIAALGAYLWSTSAKFRATLKGLWAYISTGFADLWEMVKQVFSAIGDLIIAAFELDGDGVDAAIERMTFRFSDLGKNAAKAYKEAYDEEITRSEEEGKERKEGEVALDNEPALNNKSRPLINPPGGNGGLGLGLANVGNNHTGGHGNVKNISIKIDRLIEKFEVHTTNLQESSSRIKEVVLQALTSAVNDVNLVR